MKGRIVQECIALFFVLACTNTQAQDNQKIAYYKIEKLTVETLKSWYEATNLELKSYVVYTCIPAKIIGINSTKASMVIESIRLHFNNVEEIKITNEEAIKVCSSNRKL